MAPAPHSFAHKQFTASGTLDIITVKENEVVELAYAQLCLFGAAAGVVPGKDDYIRLFAREIVGETEPALLHLRGHGQRAYDAINFDGHYPITWLYNAGPPATYTVDAFSSFVGGPSFSTVHLPGPLVIGPGVNIWIAAVLAVANVVATGVVAYRRIPVPERELELPFPTAEQRKCLIPWR